MLPEAVLWRRALAEVEGAVRLGPGVSLDVKSDADADVAIVLVTSVGPSGRCDVPMDAERIIGVALDAPFVAAEPMGCRLDRLLTPLGVLDFDQGWRVREVAPNVSAREVQAGCPFSLLAGPDLIPWVVRDD